MNLETGAAILVVFVPFGVVWGLLALARLREARRREWIARQIALTDAIHRELGAVAAPEVRRRGRREWAVSIRLPLQREATVAAITRLTHDLFRRLDRQDPPRLCLTLRPPEPRPERWSVVPGAAPTAGRLRPAA